MRARHKRDVVYGVLWDDSDQARVELEALGWRDAVGDFRYVDPGGEAGTRTLLVPTSEGERKALPGESVVVHQEDSGRYPIPLTVWNARYDVLDEVSQP